MSGAASISNGASRTDRPGSSLSNEKPGAAGARPRANSPPAICSGGPPGSDRHRFETGGSRPGQRRPRPGEGLAMHVFVEQREAMEVVRGVVFGFARERFEAGFELRRQGCGQLGATGQRRGPAVGMRQPGGIEDRVRPGDSRRPGRVDETGGVGRVRSAQDPELGEPGEVAELPGDRVQARALRHRPVVALEDVAQRRRPAVVERCGEGVAGEATRVSRHDRLRRVP